MPQPVYSAGHLRPLNGHAYLNRKYAHLKDDLAREMDHRLPESGWHFD